MTAPGLSQPLIICSIRPCPLTAPPPSPLQVATDVSFAFGSPGYVKLPLQPAPFQQLALKFKTAVPEGLLFYSTNEDRVRNGGIRGREGWWEGRGSGI